MLRLGEPDVDPTWPLILALSVPCAPSSPDGRAASSSCAWGSGWTRVLMWTPRAPCRPGTRGRPGYRIRGPAITPSARALPAGAFAPRWLFEAGAGFYGWMTAQDAWRQSCHRLVERLPSTGRPKKIVDLGCGPGIVALELARRRPQDFVSGGDVAGRMLERARRHAATRGRDRARLTWIQADATPDALQGGEHRCGHGAQRPLSPDGPWRRPRGMSACAPSGGSTPGDGAKRPVGPASRALEALGPRRGRPGVAPTASLPCDV